MAKNVDEVVRMWIWMRMDVEEPDYDNDDNDDGTVDKFIFCSFLRPPSFYSCPFPRQRLTYSLLDIWGVSQKEIGFVFVLVLSLSSAMSS